MFYGVLKVGGHRVKVIQEGFDVLSVAEMPKSIVNKMVAMRDGGVRRIPYGQVFNVTNSYVSFI